MLSKAASALIAFLQAVSSLAVHIVIDMFGACEWPWKKGSRYIAVYSLHDYGKVLKSYNDFAKDWEGSEIKPITWNETFELPQLAKR